MKKGIAISVSVLMLGMSTLSLAEPPPPPDWHGADRGYRPGPGPRFDHERPAYDRHGFREGHRLPPRYRSHRYYVNDWDNRRLPPPPPHHRWAYIDGNYVLVAVATGVITQILWGHR